jgi:hypothetical protein
MQTAVLPRPVSLTGRWLAAGNFALVGAPVVHRYIFGTFHFILARFSQTVVTFWSIPELESGKPVRTI